MKFLQKTSVLIVLSLATSAYGRIHDGLRRNLEPTPKVAAVFRHYFDGFEEEDEDAVDRLVNSVRVPSLTDGIPSYEGDYHGTISAGSGPYMWFGGINTATPPYQTSLYVYLDPSTCDGDNKGFDFTSATFEPGSDDGHRRDYIFHIGCDAEADEQWVGAFAASASHNTNWGPGEANSDSVGNPSENLEGANAIKDAGWYQLVHYFYADKVVVPGSDVLTCDMSIIGPNGNTLVTWTLQDQSDIIGETVEGNRYGWFTYNGIDGLAIDNIEMRSEVDKNACKKGGWETLIRLDGTPFKNQGDCVSYMNRGEK
mmetsp:Transcript_24126/g.42379  ORF Transcript_24126/g.42379 Transcript_24126/m.42379 type:complete len:312 (+) Transcript_24126:122-1057(+)|eukprot:CAMPEP_0178786382 /NCGR_PEP_ID=MMETSP0745-20121128/5286_1 /TAXON_ID=913974 /ORGANISM="Nitzschia punctata, Strain CCMP561" /LENGTH=311 /DNA_ID=CAMNT_0020444151 /DNA_START=101 /DNA_END=1036 /DNA_ORIENTATION=-